MSATPDIIASLVLQEYEKLPAKRKPPVRDNGLHEWVPLSGIVAEFRGGDDLRCLSLATGMKCLPQAKLPLAQGNVLHDWHAEVLAIRAFNRFVLDECKLLAEGGPEAESLFLRRRHVEELPSATTTPWCGQPFTWREDVKLHMYCSEAPCGDASMELTMAAQADATPWEVPSPAVDISTPATPTPDSPSAPAPPVLPGRAYFQHLGVVRRKPARGDAPATLSKSCSDKLALRQCTSLLSSAASLLVSPTHAYLTTLILPTSQHSATGCERAFSGRMAAMKGMEVEAGLLHGGYRFAPFQINTTDLEFAYSRRSVANRLALVGAAAGADKMAASNLAVAWTATGLEEASLGGTMQGRKLFDPRGASFASRRKMWALAVEIASLLGAGLVGIQKTLAAQNYKELKKSNMLQPRRDVKSKATSTALKGWVKNEGDDDFSL